jgi:cytidylate kinase
MSVTTNRGFESLTRLRDCLDAQVYHEREGRPKARPEKEVPPLTIALSRQAGSRGAEIARAVGERLGWPVYDHELLDHIAAEKGLSTRLLEQLDERHSGWLEEAVRSFCTTDGARDGYYLRGLLGLLISLGKVGHCVIVGRGAAQVLPPEATLSVRVIAPRGDRIAQVEKRRGTTKAEAERWVDQHDRERILFVKHHFRADAEDPLLYDLVLNSKRLSTEECAAMIVALARSWEAQVPPSAR